MTASPNSTPSTVVPPPQDTAPAPFLSVRSMPLRLAQQTPFGNDTVVISLVPPGELVPRLVAQERVAIRLPNPSAGGPPNMAALLDGVRRIATTLRGYAYTDRHLVIHCLNGVASSPAVANAIADVWPMLCEHLSPAILPNRLVREQMVVALNNERAQHPNPVSTPVRAPR